MEQFRLDSYSIVQEIEVIEIESQNQNIDYIFRKAQRQLELAGITYAIPGIKRRSK